MSIDHELLLQIKKGDAQAMEAFYDRYSTLVYRYAFALANDPLLAEQYVLKVFEQVRYHTADFQQTGRPLIPMLHYCRDHCYGQELSTIS